MSVSSLAYEARGSVSALRRAAAMIELTKPKIALLELFTVAVAATVAANGLPGQIGVLLHALLGTAFIAASASACNQLIERDRDATMPRTAGRPLPAGILTTREVALFGGCLLLAGIFQLIFFVNIVTALVGMLTWFLYVVVYTPMKTRSSAKPRAAASACCQPA